jgi:hypothetical protein
MSAAYKKNRRCSKFKNEKAAGRQKSARRPEIKRRMIELIFLARDAELDEIPVAHGHNLKTFSHR